MLKKRWHRRVVAFGLIILGGALMFLAPEVWAGVLMMILGVAVEMIGITLDHKRAD
jgi:fatty-acid desaturase